MAKLTAAYRADSDRARPRSDGPPRSRSRPTTRRRIALFLWTFDNDYQALLRSDCMAAARRHGFALDEYSAGGDADTQVRQITSVLQGGSEGRPAALVVCPVRESALLATAHHAARQGIGWVVLNRSSMYLEDLRQRFADLPVFCVNPDQQQIGRIQGQQFKALLPDGGELLYIQGPPLTSSARGRLEGAREEVRGSGINMVPFSTDWSAEGAAGVVRNWLRIVDRRWLGPCIVGAQNDHMAEGARWALQQEAVLQGRPELAKIRVTGCDGVTTFGQRLVSDGRLAATVVVPPTAARALEGVRDALDRGRLPPLELQLPVASFPTIDALTRQVACGC